MPLRVTRAGYIPRLTDSEITTSQHFGEMAVEHVRAVGSAPYSGLSPEEAKKLGAEWYEACAYVLHFGSLGKLEEVLRREIKKIGSDPELKTLRALFAAMNQTYRQIGWTAEAVDELGSVIEGVLADLGLVKRVAPAKAAEAARFGEVRVEAPAAPKKPKRARVAMTARVRATDYSAGIDEIIQTESMSRDGMVFLSSLPYTPGMHLSVILPYTKRPDEDKFNTMSGEVVRVEPGEEKPAVEVKFVR